MCRRIRLAEIDNQRPQGLPGDGGDLAGDSVDPRAVRPVRRYLDIKNGIVEFQQLIDVGSDNQLKLGIEVPDPR